MGPSAALGPLIAPASAATLSGSAGRWPAVIAVPAAAAILSVRWRSLTNRRSHKPYAVEPYAARSHATFAVPMRCMLDQRMGRVDATLAAAVWPLAPARRSPWPAVPFAMLRLRLARLVMSFASPIRPPGFG